VATIRSEVWQMKKQQNSIFNKSNVKGWNQEKKSIIEKIITKKIRTSKVWESK